MARVGKKEPGWRLAGKGGVPLPAPEESSAGGHHPLRRPLATVSPPQKATSSALSRRDVAIQRELPESTQPPRPQVAGRARAWP